jgi:hypothetical protein
MYVYDADQIREADEQRTKRMFVGLMASLLGVQDQTYTTDDNQARGQVGQFTIANPDGGVSVQGQPVSNMNTVTAVAGIPVPWLMLGALAFFLLRR